MWLLSPPQQVQHGGIRRTVQSVEIVVATQSGQSQTICTHCVVGMCAPEEFLGVLRDASAHESKLYTALVQTGVWTNPAQGMGVITRQKAYFYQVVYLV